MSSVPSLIRSPLEVLLFQMSLFGKGSDIETLTLLSREEIFKHGLGAFSLLCAICHCFLELDRRLTSHRWEINMSASLRGEKKIC